MGKQESAVRQTTKMIRFCRSRGEYNFSCIGYPLFGYLKNLHMTGTLTLLYFSLGKGGSWGLEQLPQFIIIYLVPAVDVSRNSVPDTKISRIVPLEI